MGTGLATFAAVAALLSVSTPQHQLTAGPVLAGERVVWGEQVDGVSALRIAGTAAPVWQSTPQWFNGPLAASTGLIAFTRSFPGCATQSGVACPVESQAVSGPQGRSLRSVAPAERCTTGGRGRRLAVSGSYVAYLGISCVSVSSSVLVSKQGRTVYRHAASCCDVSLAWPYLAFRSDVEVDLVDLRTRRLVSTTGTPTGEQIAAFDVQHDGTLAVVVGRNTTGRDLLAWRSPGGVLKRTSVAVVVPPTSAAVCFVGGRLVFVSPRSGSRTALVSMDLRRRTRTIAGFGGSVEQVGGIDASLHTVTWSSRLITGTRTDCPPPGELRPCRLLKSGVETVWAAGLYAGAPRVVARWSFADSA
jgi:hypothetical protein